MHNPLPLRERQRAQLVNEVRRVALQLFAERGFDAVTIDDIAAGVGASRSTVFRVVDTKESLVLDRCWKTSPAWWPRSKRAATTMSSMP